MKLIEMLEQVMSEIGDASKEPYPFKRITDEDDEREYIFSTDSGFKYEVNIVTNKEDAISRVGFGVINDETGELSYEKQTGEQDVYKIMSTITAIVKEDLKTNPYQIDTIEFTPSKRKDNTTDKDPTSNVRTKLYSRYIKGQFPNAEVTQTIHGDIRVILNK